MTNVWAFVVAHQTVFALGAFYVWSAFIGALPAPTAQSSSFYQFIFSFFNILGANLARAKGPMLENSPNWQDAVAKAQATPKVP